jgi:hypothetical protein
MKKALVRLRCSVPDSDGWKRTPWRCIQPRTWCESRMTRRASASVVRPPVTFFRSCQNSSSG